jgi:hypothetical protein
MVELGSTLVHSYEWPEGRHHLGVVAKRAYRIRQGGRAEPAAEQPAIRIEPEYVAPAGAPEAERLVHDSDVFALVRPLTDVLLAGSAHARVATDCVETALRVGGARKSVRVFGDRRVVRSPATGELRFSPAESFKTMPIEWGRSYGGSDADAGGELLGQLMDAFASLGLGEARAEDLPLTSAYPRNAVGRGFLVGEDAERLVGTVVPNLDDPEDPVLVGRLMTADWLDWLDLPVPAGYGPLDPITFPRSAFAFPRLSNAPARPVRELALGGLLPADLCERDLLAAPDARMHNGAPPGLAVCRLEGGERVSLWNLHRAHALLEFDLPTAPRRLLLEPPGVAARELSPRLGTVLIEPDRDLVTLTWAGSLEVAAPYPVEKMEAMRHACVWS